MRRSSLAASMLLLVTVAAPAPSQEIRGTVVEARSDRPLEGVVLTVTDGTATEVASAITDAAGRFRVAVVVDDSVLLRVERMDYETLESVPIALDTGEQLDLAIRLRPRPVDAGEITAVARRQRSWFGHYLGRDDLARNPPATATWAVLRLPYVVQAGPGVRVMGQDTLCSPTIYVDGSYHDVPAEQLDSWVSGPSIRAVELYRDRNQAPADYVLPGRENCAILLIWTRHALGSDGLDEWPWRGERD